MPYSPRFAANKTLLTVAILLFSLGGRSLCAQAVPKAVIPFVVKNNCIYLRCVVNATDSLTFLFDTGADGSVISAASPVAKKLPRSGTALNVGSNGRTTVDQSRGNTIAFGGLTKTDVTLSENVFELALPKSQSEKEKTYEFKFVLNKTDWLTAPHDALNRSGSPDNNLTFKVK